QPIASGIECFEFKPPPSVGRDRERLGSIGLALQAYPSLAQRLTPCQRDHPSRDSTLILFGRWRLGLLRAHPARDYAKREQEQHQERQGASRHGRISGPPRVYAIQTCRTGDGLPHSWPRLPP